MGIGDVRRTGENRPWTAHPADQTDPSPHRDRRESRRDGESASHGEFVNTLLDNEVSSTPWPGVQAIRLRGRHEYWRIGKMPVRLNWPIMPRAVELGGVGGGEEATSLVESLDYEYTTYDAVG